MKTKAIIIIFTLITGIWACNNAEQKAPKEKPKEEPTQAPEPASLSDAEKQEYLKKGKEIASATFQALSGELKAAMGRGGVEEAIQYCNVNAMPITDSLSQEYNATVRRAAMKYRNPENALQGDEKKAYKVFDLAIKNGKKPKPSVSINNDGQATFYAPIVMKPLCLNCHGDVETQITQANYDIIKKFYPEDKATGFSEGELRGIWSIAINE